MQSRGWSPHYAQRMAGMQASEIRELLKVIERPGVISFAGGIPDPGLFPRALIQQSYDAILQDERQARRALQYSMSEGDPELRSWIVEHMRAKGVECTVDNILITSGSQQALEFLGKLFVSPRDRVLVTAPTYLGALQAFAPNQPRYGDITISSNGTVTEEDDASSEQGGRTAFAYVVPDFANPTGETLGEEARRNIIDLAASLDTAVIEDSPYEVLRFDGIAQPCMLALDAAANGGIDRARVVYCGSFSKIFTPGLRVGWVCAAREIVHRLTLIKQGSDLNSPAINQMVMLHLARNAYATQADLARKVYREKRDAMLGLMADVLPSGSRWSRPEGGMFIWVTLPDGFDATEMLPRAVENHGVAYVPGRAFFANGGGGNTMRLSYTLPTRDEIEDGLRRLGACLAQSC
jgi:DNA-binding transcriptional MocR family regulator